MVKLPKFDSKRIKKLKHFLWLFFQYSGLRYIWHMIEKPIDPETGKRRPSNFVLWVLGIYGAFFGLALQRYEMRIARLETRYNSYIEQLGDENTPSILTSISEMIDETVPVEPQLFWPPSVFQSFTRNENYEFVSVEGKNTIRNWSQMLSDVKFNRLEFDSLLIRSSVENLEIFRSKFSNLRFYSGSSDDIRISFSEINDFRVYSSQVKKLQIYRQTGQSAWFTFADFEDSYFVNSDIEMLILHNVSFYKSHFINSPFDYIENPYPNLYVECVFDSTTFKSISSHGNGNIYLGCKILNDGYYEYLDHRGYQNSSDITGYIESKHVKPFTRIEMDGFGDPLKYIRDAFPSFNIDRLEEYF